MNLKHLKIVDKRGEMTLGEFIKHKVRPSSSVCFIILFNDDYSIMIAMNNTLPKLFMLVQLENLIYSENFFLVLLVNTP